jgi:hypothetical protein
MRIACLVHLERIKVKRDKRPVKNVYRTRKVKIPVRQHASIVQLVPNPYQAVQHASPVSQACTTTTGVNRARIAKWVNTVPTKWPVRRVSIAHWDIFKMKSHSRPVCLVHRERIKVKRDKRPAKNV